MNQMRSGTGGTAAVLAGSLAAFPLLDVLRLLGRTRHVGSLQVVGDGVEAHLWVDSGELVDHPGAAADRLFELACLDDAWFTVTGANPPEHATDERVSLQPLLEQVAPQVAEWQTLVRALPFGAVARMAPAMPGPEVQIRSDQWRILSLIGAGRPVHEVVDVADGRPLETLRLVHELAQQQLISVEVPAAGTPERPGRRSAAEHQAIEREVPVSHATSERPDTGADTGGAPGAAGAPTPAPTPAPAPTAAPASRTSAGAAAPVGEGPGVPASPAPAGPPARSAPADRPGGGRVATRPAKDDGATGPGARVVPVRGNSGPLGWRRSSGSTSVTAPAPPDGPEGEQRGTGRESGFPPTGSVAPGSRAGTTDRTAMSGARPLAFMPPPVAPARWPGPVDAGPPTVEAPETVDAQASVPQG